MKQKITKDLHQYRTFGLPLVVLMVLLGLAGIVITVGLHFLFSA